MAVYLDSSAIVKLIAIEPESRALLRFLGGTDRSVTSALSRTEVVRAVMRGGQVAVDRARIVLGTMAEVVLTRTVLDRAAELDPGVRLRPLDAIHLASALRLGAELDVIVTYDSRMASAATSLGLVAEAPA